MTKTATAETLEGEVAMPKPKKKQEVATVRAAAPPPAPRQAPTLLEVVRDAAANPAVDVEKMRPLLQMAREEEDRQAERDAFAALIQMQSARPRVTKDRASDKHKYATLEKVSTELDPLISQYGFAISYGMADSPLEGHYRITALLMHGRSGWKKEYFIDFPAGGNKSAQGKELMTSQQGIGVIISYGRRYLKLMIFDVTIAGEDIDAALPADTSPISEKQLEKLKQAIEFKNVNVEKLLEKFAAPSLEEFPRAKFDKAMSLIAQKEAPATEGTNAG